MELGKSDRFSFMNRLNSNSTQIRFREFILQVMIRLCIDNELINEFCSYLQTYTKSKESKTVHVYNDIVFDI